MLHICSTAQLSSVIFPVSNFPINGLGRRQCIESYLNAGLLCSNDVMGHSTAQSHDKEEDPV